MKKIVGFFLTAMIASMLIAGFSACKDTTPVFTYNYGLTETVTPYWENVSGDYTVIYNEVVTPLQYGDSETATGYLAYEPYRIISVRDYTLQKEYGEKDYTVIGNAVTVKTDGSMPYIKNEWLDNKNIPEKFSDYVVEGGTDYNDHGGTNRGKHVISEGSLIRTNHLCITYAYDSSEQEMGFAVPKYVPENFARFLGKMEKGENVRILVFGDSIFTGASASSVVGFEPKLPAFFDLMKSELAVRYYGGDETKITVVNQSVGGTTSEWGAEQIRNGAFDTSGFDLVMIGFGMNDGFAGFDTSPAVFTRNIRSITEGIRQNSPTADYLIVGPFTPNPKSVFAGNHDDLIQPVSEMCSEINGETSGCTYISMFEMTTAILENKQKNNTEDGRYQYVDISANYTNHPNDFTVRLYAGAILSVFLTFDGAVHAI